MTDMTGKSVLILGASSDISIALAHKYAAEGYDLLLAARDPDALSDEAADLRTRHERDVQLISFDVLNYEGHGDFIAQLAPLPDVVISVIGLMTEQASGEQNPAEARAMMESNFVGPTLFLGQIAEAFKKRGHGVIIGISSVAGDRGRRSNYLYGSSKAGFTSFLSGLRAACFTAGVSVITVLPGFVNARMSGYRAKPKLLVASPEAVAEAVYKAQVKKRDVIYVLSIWRYIMLVIKGLPEWLFKRLSF